ncbi:hypothetical protein F5B20DRAFT_253831 [Whalleya microplaca]|nr:hypothetical protein F5B20DRAFT_253831 [Whalleya microplaca]
MSDYDFAISLATTLVDSFNINNTLKRVGRQREDLPERPRDADWLSTKLRDTFGDPIYNRWLQKELTDHSMELAEDWMLLRFRNMWHMLERDCRRRRFQKDTAYGSPVHRVANFAVHAPNMFTDARLIESQKYPLRAVPLDYWTSRSIELFGRVYRIHYKEALDVYSFTLDEDTSENLRQIFDWLAMYINRYLLWLAQSHRAQHELVRHCQSDEDKQRTERKTARWLDRADLGFSGFIREFRNLIYERKNSGRITRASYVRTRAWIKYVNALVRSSRINPHTQRQEGYSTWFGSPTRFPNFNVKIYNHNFPALRSESRPDGDPPVPDVEFDDYQLAGYRGFGGLGGQGGVDGPDFPDAFYEGDSDEDDTNDLANHVDSPDGPPGPQYQASKSLLLSRESVSCYSLLRLH